MKNMTFNISDHTYDPDKQHFRDISPTLCADYRLYEQIFYHLMQNAIKFSKNGSKVIVEINA